MFTGQTPDVTPAQLAALATFIVGQLVAFGVINGHSRQLAVSIASAALAISWKLADAYLRGQRAKALIGPPAAAAKPGVTVT